MKITGLLALVLLAGCAAKNVKPAASEWVTPECTTIRLKEPCRMGDLKKRCKFVVALNCVAAKKGK